MHSRSTHSLWVFSALFAIFQAHPALAQEHPPVNALEGQHPAQNQELPRIMKLDTNHDNFLSRQEVQGRPWLEKHFNRIDTNADQLLSTDELKAARNKIREHRQREQG